MPVSAVLAMAPECGRVRLRRRGHFAPLRGVTNYQLRDIGLAYIAAHTKDRHLEAVTLLNRRIQGDVAVRALIKKWPPA
jgi:hypothetical protein